MPVPALSLSSSMEMCDQRHNITMCPLCDKTCSYWKMSSACATARASHLFDNPATVFFSVFMALWGEWGSPHGSPGRGGCLRAHVLTPAARPLSPFSSKKVEARREWQVLGLGIWDPCSGLC